MVSILQKSILIILEVSFFLTIVNELVACLVLVLQVVIIECLVPLGLHFLDQHLCLWSNISIDFVGTLCCQRL